MARIRKGERFNSFQEFYDEKELYEKRVFANYVVIKSVIDKENPDLKYTHVRYDCSKAKEHVKTTTNRETKSGKTGCGSYISVEQKKIGENKVLEIVQVVDMHNHPLSSDLFSHMPKQRKQMIKDNKEQLESFFATKSNVASIQTKLCSEQGRVITRRDLYNAKVKWKEKKSQHENELVQLVEQMAAIENSTTKLIVNNNDEVEFIFFQDEKMKQNFAAFPDLILFDGTYNLNNRKMPLVVIMVVDGSGVSHVAGFIIVQSENAQTFERSFDIFKEENPNHTKIEIIMSDKSFANRAAFARAFPNAEHHFCVFHVLQIVQREITTQKREITADQRTQIQDILRAMLYAKSETKYVHLYDKLKALNCRKVNEYFDANWHNIRDQWVAFYCNQHRNYEERTNNRLESFNQKIKAIVSKYRGIAQFFEDLWTCTVSYNIERDHQLADDVLRKSLNLPDFSPIAQYVDILTNHAYQKVRQQYMKGATV